MSRLTSSRGEPILCYVTDRRTLSEQDPVHGHETLLRRIAAVASAGVDWIQIREKDLSGKDSGTLTSKAVLRALDASGGRANPTRVLINDRVDVALSRHAGGVHLSETSVPIADARRLSDSHGHRGDFLIGVSCHSLEAARSAELGGADYIFFGPVFPTPRKAAYGAPQGVERLAEVCRAISVPVLAIGGLSLGNAGSCFAAGASGIAAIRLFQEAEDVKRLVAGIGKLTV